jgi:DNA-binding response OmpR family regulator
VKMTETIKILIIDDDTKLLESLEAVLFEKGYLTETATIGKEGLIKAEKSIFNVALVGLKLPDFVGTEVIQTLRKKSPSIIIIIITVNPAQQSAIEALNLGVSDFIMKPLDPEKVDATIKRLIARTHGRMPNVDVIDSDKAYVVKAELPGLKKENVEIVVGMNELSLIAKPAVEDEKGKIYLQKEIARDAFRRYIGFAERVDIEKVSATMSEGMLEVKLTKLDRNPEKQRRKVAIQ